MGVKTWTLMVLLVEANWIIKVLISKVHEWASKRYGLVAWGKSAFKRYNLFLELQELGFQGNQEFGAKRTLRVEEYLLSWLSLNA